MKPEAEKGENQAEDLCGAINLEVMYLSVHASRVCARVQRNVERGKNLRGKKLSLSSF